MLHLAWIVPLLLLIFYIASPRHRGDIAGSRVRRILAQGLEKNRYTVLNDITVPAGGGTVSIDHVVVSRFGIFVIESVHARGWISGTDVQDRWKRQHLGRTARFDNPVYRNRLQAQALEALLDFPGRVFHRIVVLTGHRGFRHETPLEVVEAERLIPAMRKKGEQLLTSEQAARALKGIEAGRLKTGGGFFVNRDALIRAFLLLVLAGGLYLAFGEDLRRVYDDWSLQSEMRDAPGDFHPDGRRKTERELWEDSLRCAYSPDTGRCSCYEPDGARADLDFEQCRELAERGSILRQ